MKTIAILLLSILTGCASIDSGITKDATMTGEDLLALSQACKKAGGVLEAKKVFVLATQKYEFRVSCKNGATYVIDPAQQDAESIK